MTGLSVSVQEPKKPNQKVLIESSMLEKDIENLLSKCPEEFLSDRELIFKGQQVKLGINTICSQPLNNVEVVVHRTRGSDYYF
jgi:hypothetical protein